MAEEKAKGESRTEVPSSTPSPAASSPSPTPTPAPQKKVWSLCSMNRDSFGLLNISKQLHSHYC